MELKRKQILDEKGHIRNTSIRMIEVDYNSLEELEKLSNVIRSQIGHLKSNSNGSRNKINKLKFWACQEIYNTDISDLYSELNLSESRNYYVYAHCEPNKIAVGKNGVTTWAATHGLDQIPFYIGKGIGNRAYDLNRNETHRKVRQRLKEFSTDVQVKIIKDEMTELEALCLESKLIDIFGLIGKGGSLVNLNEGVKFNERRERYKDHLIQLSSYYKNSLMVEA